MYRIIGIVRQAAEFQLPDFPKNPKIGLAAEINSELCLFVPSSYFFCCQSQLRTKPPSRKAAALILRVVLFFTSITVPLRHMFVSASRCRTSLLMLHKVVFLHVSSTTKNGALNLPWGFTRTHHGCCAFVQVHKLGGLETITFLKKGEESRPQGPGRPRQAVHGPT